MKILPGNAQNIGQRISQQDAFWFSDIRDRRFIVHGGVLAIVADGMGGLKNGAEASSLAVRTFSETYLNKAVSDAIPDALNSALEQANQAVCALASSVNELNNVGTTLVAAVIADNSLHWISVGDSRLYLYRHGELTQLTRDHNYGAMLQEQVANGCLSQQDAENNPDRNALTSFVGYSDLSLKDCNVTPLRSGDWVLLCSDGLHGSLSEQEIALEMQGQPQEAADHLIKRVLQKGKSHQDNITVAIMSYQSDDFNEQAPKRFWKQPILWIVLLCMNLLIAAGWLGYPYLKRKAETAPEVVTAQPIPLPVATTPTPPSVDQQIQELMDQAEADMRQEHYNQAVDNLDKVLDLQKDYTPAKEKLKQISEKLTEQAQIAMDAQKPDEAKVLINTAQKALLASEPNIKLDEAQRRLKKMQADATKAAKTARDQANAKAASQAKTNSEKSNGQTNSPEPKSGDKDSKPSTSR